MLMTGRRFFSRRDPNDLQTDIDPLCNSIPKDTAEHITRGQSERAMKAALI